jgi:hypothetical protein
MMIEIDDDTLDRLLLCRLRQDYKMIVKDIAALQSQAVKGGLERYQQEDLSDFLNISHHMEAMLVYYDCDDWRTRL